MIEAFSALLLADADIAGLAADRVHWRVQPKNAGGFPYVNLAIVSDPRVYHMKGVSKLRRTGVQADAWAESYAEAYALKTAIENAMPAAQSVLLGIKFQGAFVIGSRDLTDRTAGDERTLFRFEIDLEIHWNEEP